MKYSLIALRNTRHALGSVRYDKIADAFLSGGVFLDEVLVLPYDGASELAAALTRLSYECDGVFLTCDGVLLSYLKDAVSVFCEGRFSGDFITETEKCLFAVLPASDAGADLVCGEVIPLIDKRRRKRYDRMVIRTVAAPSELLRTTVASAENISGGKLSYNLSEKFGDGRLEIIYDSETPKMLADEVLRVAATQLNDFMYAMEDIPLARRLYDVLKLRRLRLATAESFTGGGVGRALVEISGASAFFYEGLNTYDNQSKINRLGVSPYTIKSHGAVSDEVAYEMAAGLIAQGNCDVAVATTGIAGPKSDGSDKPVGLCFIAVGTKEKVRVYRYQLEGDREKITETAINLALFLTYKEIK